ncbi:EMC6-like membrane protein [Candidatus Halobonum tyrrellensis]|uniref:Uncharacterized protein n=1 Tax=Candidatus Halobonum tyrrellensis G22 TaxID=1324957 RepID=V4GR90_9EURY|nr:hypothetical protein [Candidatus Halobonum tyrrellensis]ESP87571.1 hypothetical protein K933_13344 [Candidatus Halobonum tyrrellensis G22]
MATETASGLSDHARGVTVTTAACLAGILAALVSATVLGVGIDAATSQLQFAVVLAAMFVQYPLLKLVGVAVEEFGVKDNLYVGFMTFSLWFITYGILLSAGISA